MAHSTRINGTSYGITGGKCLVNGTSYSIKKGRTLIGGTGYDITFGTPLSAYAEEDIVYINENGSPVEFYVAKHDYESGLNGAGRTLVVRKDCYEERVWNSAFKNTYSSSSIDAWLNGEYLAILDPGIQASIGTTKFSYTPGDGVQTLGTLDRSVFILSVFELGFGAFDINKEGSTLPIANLLRVLYMNGSPVSQWTRSPSLREKYFTGVVYDDGSQGFSQCTNVEGCRPVFTLPSSIIVGDGGIVA